MDRLPPTRPDLTLVECTACRLLLGRAGRLCRIHAKEAANEPAAEGTTEESPGGCSPKNKRVAGIDTVVGALKIDFGDEPAMEEATTRTIDATMQYPDLDLVTSNSGGRAPRSSQQFGVDVVPNGDDDSQFGSDVVADGSQGGSPGTQGGVWLPPLHKIATAVLRTLPSQNIYYCAPLC